MSGFSRLSLDPLREPLVLQGWFPMQAESLAAGMAEAGALGVLRVPAFPDIADLRARIDELSTVKGRIGLMPQGLGQNLYGELSVDENIDFFARLRLVPKAQLQSSDPKVVTVRVKG